MIRKTMPLLFVLVFLFSGCLGIFEEDPEPTNGEEGDSSDGTNDGLGDSETDNEGPESNETAAELDASLEANVTEGAAPLNVSFTLNGSHSQDAPLNWSLDIGEEEGSESGDGLPTTVNHTFEGPGNMTVVLNVTDGTRTAEANVTIEVTAADESEPVVLEGSVAVPHPIMWVTGAESCASFASGQAGVDCDFLELEEEWAGLPFTTHADSGDIDVEFRSSCDVTSDSVELVGASGHDEGTIPEGSGCVVVANFTESGEFTMTIG